MGFLHFHFHHFQVLEPLWQGLSTSIYIAHLNTSSLNFEFPESFQVSRVFSNMFLRNTKCLQFCLCYLSLRNGMSKNSSAGWFFHPKALRTCRGSPGFEPKSSLMRCFWEASLQPWRKLVNFQWHQVVITSSFHLTSI